MSNIDTKAESEGVSVNLPPNEDGKSWGQKAVSRRGFLKTGLMGFMGLAAGCDLIADSPLVTKDPSPKPGTGGDDLLHPKYPGYPGNDPTPTPEPTQEPPTPTPEVPKNIDCSLFSKDVCSKAEVVEVTNSAGEKFTIVGLDPDKGEKILMPMDNWQVAKTKLADDDAIRGYRSQIFNPNNPTMWIVVVGDYQPDNMFSENLQKGKSFGTVQNTGILNSGHKIVVYVIENIGGKSIMSQDKLQQIFKGIDFSKPSSTAIITKQEGTPSPINTTGFYSKQP